MKKSKRVIILFAIIIILICSYIVYLYYDNTSNNSSRESLVRNEVSINSSEESSMKINDTEKKDEEKNIVQEDNKDLAINFFKEHIGIYDDYEIDESSIEIYEEDGDYTIIGNGFNPIHASSCVKTINEGEDIIYLFKSADGFGDTFYKIRVNDLSVIISYGDSEDDCNNVCGRFEIRE